jgi:hypothetical protein
MGIMAQSSTCADQLPVNVAMPFFGKDRKHLTQTPRGSLGPALCHRIKFKIAPARMRQFGNLCENFARELRQLNFLEAFAIVSHRGRRTIRGKYENMLPEQRRRDYGIWEAVTVAYMVSGR